MQNSEILKLCELKQKQKSDNPRTRKLRKQEMCQFENAKIRNSTIQKSKNWARKESIVFSCGDWVRDFGISKSPRANPGILKKAYFLRRDLETSLFKIKNLKLLRMTKIPENPTADT